MKKFFALVVALQLVAPALLRAEDVPSPVTPEAPAAETATTAIAAEAVVEAPPAPAAAEPVVAETVPVEAPAAAAAVITPAPAVENSDITADNLEFISGEITGMDEAAKSVTVKMYGENAENEADKMLTVSVDATTDITDGEQDRDLKSLVAGTEVDVEYDPASKKATYIFVY